MLIVFTFTDLRAHSRAKFHQQQEFNEGTMTPYVWNNVTGEFITYDDPVSINYKWEYAVSVGMQGMMVWEVATIEPELLSFETISASRE